jgi:hypothetical protein
MRKLTWMVACSMLLLMGSSLALADEQDDPTGPRPRLGVEGGFNLANLNGPNVNDIFASRLGFVGGAFLNLPLGKGLALQGEVLYSQKGGKINGSPYQLDYVEFPILLDVKVLGPIGVLMGPAFNTTVADQGLASVSRTDVGLVLGVQVFLSKFLVSGRYEIGLTDVDSNEAAQNGTFTFMAGFSFI